MTLTEFVGAIGCLFCIVIVGGFLMAAFPGNESMVRGAQVATGILCGMWIRA